MDKIEIQVTATIDLTKYVECINDDIVEMIEDVSENLIDEEGYFDYKSQLQIKKTLVAEVIKRLAKIYLDDDEE